MLQKPFSAKCDNRADLAKQNRVAGAPEDWFDNSILDGFGKIGISFDFFVNWSKRPYQLTPNIWVKRILNIPPNTLSDIDIENALIDFEGRDYLSNLARFAEIQKLKLTYLLFREIEWGKEEEEIIAVTITVSGSNLVLKVQRTSLDILRKAIRSHSGGPVRIGNKGLTYGTSKLECFLASTDSAYPGDVDLLILDKPTLNPEIILENKKHNLKTPISDQRLGNYYPAPDRRKYDRLAVLRDYLTPNPALVNLYYPTNNEEHAKVEIFGGDVGKLSPSENSLVDLPTKGDVQSYKEFVNKVITMA